MKKNTYIFFALVVTVAAFLATSCRRYADPPPYFEEQGDTTRPVSRKVLVIGIDGAVGSEYKAIAPPALEAMKAHSKFSWDAVSDLSTTDAASWKTLMTGISYDRHQIKDSSFIYTQAIGADEHGVIPNYPSFFSYILSSARSDMKTTFVSSWDNLLNRLVPEVEDKILAVDDAAVKDSAVARLKNANRDIVMVHFNSVARAGKSSSFAATSDEYKNAVLKVDSYISEIMTALKARPAYNKTEEWLVIVTGTHGGEGNGYGGYSAKETNVVSFYYNEKLSQEEFVGSISSATIGLGSSDVYATVEHDNDLYNFGQTGEYTVELKVKIPAGNYNYPSVLSKRARFSGGFPGWTVFLEGDYWQVNFGLTGGGNRQIRGAKVSDGQWHTISWVIKNSGNTRIVRTFTDGVFNNQGDVTDRGNVNSPAPLTLGYLPGDATPSVKLNVTDIRIFSTALSDAEIRENACLTNPLIHPKAANLIGYWKGTEGFGASFKNYAPGKEGLDFNLKRTFAWEPLASLPCSITPLPASNNRQMLIKSTDLVPTIFYWLRMPVKTEWNLEGTKWIENYEREFIKL